MRPFFQLHPITYLYIAGTVILLMVSLPIEGQFVICIVLIALAVLTPSSRRHVRRVLRYLGLAMIFMFLLNGLIFPEAIEVYNFGWFSLKKEGLRIALEIGLRLVLMTISQLLLFTGTPPHILATIMAERGISPQLIYIFLYSINLFKILNQRISKIHDAQISRGLSTKGNIFQRAAAIIPIIVPLSLSYLFESVERSLALELKGMGCKGPKTSLAQLQFSRKEYLAGRLIFSIGILFFLIRIAVWFVKQ